MERSDWVLVLSIFTIGVAVIGCAVIPKSIEKEALPDMPLPALIEQADQYVGKTVILGGYVLEVRNNRNETRIVAIQAPLAGIKKRAAF